MPSAQYGIDYATVVEEPASLADRQFVAADDVKHVRDIIGGDGAVGIFVVDVLEIPVNAARGAVSAAHTTVSGVRERVHKHSSHVGGLSVGNLLGEGVSGDELKAA